MAKKKSFSKLQCATCKRVNYFTKKSRQLKGGEKKLELSKFCCWDGKHTVHKEIKK